VCAFLLHTSSNIHLYCLTLIRIRDEADTEKQKSAQHRRHNPDNPRSLSAPRRRRNTLRHEHNIDKNPAGTAKTNEATHLG